MGAGFKLSEYYFQHGEWRRDGPHLPLSMELKAFSQAETWEFPGISPLWRNGGRLILTFGLVSKLLSCILTGYLSMERLG